MKIIDAHIHYCDEPYFDTIARDAGHENSEAHLRETFARENILHGVVMGNRALTDQRHTYPDFLSYCIGFDSFTFTGGAIDKAPEVAEHHLRRENCVGVKIYAGYCPYYVYDKVYQPLYELARTYKKPVAIHTGATAGKHGLLKYSHPLTVDEVACMFPDVQFVMCHCGNPWLVDAASVLTKNDNVSADLSGILVKKPDLDVLMSVKAGYIEHIKTWLQYAGAYDRLMFGTDWPLANIRSYIEFVAMLIPERRHDEVFFENANRIYQLGL